MAVFEALLDYGDTVLSMDLSNGGHLSHGSPVNYSGKHFNVIQYALVAQLDRVTDSDSVGRWFESSRACQKSHLKRGGFLRPADENQGFVEAAAEARQPLRTVKSRAAQVFREPPAAVEKPRSAEYPFGRARKATSKEVAFCIDGAFSCVLYLNRIQYVFTIERRNCYGKAAHGRQAARFRVQECV